MILGVGLDSHKAVMYRVTIKVDAISLIKFVLTAVPA